VPGRQTERFLTTVLFTDIVGSTEMVAELGDRGWRELVQEHHKVIRAALKRHGGREVDTAGDGFFAIFDAPAAAAQCALDAVEAVKALGLQIRAGLHVGEVEQIGAKVGGIAVPIGARIMAAAGASEVLASETVRDLAEGSGLHFEERGERELKGVPGTRRLYAVVPSVQPAVQPGASTVTGEEQAARRAAAVRRSEARPFWQRHPRLSSGVAFGVAIVIVSTAVLAWSPWRPKALAGIAENAVGVIDPSRNEIVGETKVEDQPGAIAVGQDAVWVTNSGSNTVSRIDPKTGAVVRSIDVGKNPAGLAVGNGSVWVANSGERSVTRINIETGRAVESIAVGNGPTAIGFGGGAVWVVNTSDGTLTRIDATTGEAGPATSVASLPDAIAVDESGIWVASQDGATVTHLDPASGAALAAPMAVGSRPSAIAIGADSIWVANAGDGTVSRIDPTNDRVIGVVDVGEAPTDLAVDGSTLWVADGAGAIDRFAIDNLSAAPITIVTGSAPQAIALVDGEVWFASRASAASHQGGTLRVVTAQAGGVDPNYYFEPELTSLLGSGLVGYRRIGGIAGSQLVPYLATSVPKATDGGLTYSFHLRPDIVYSDGAPVRASDFKFALERVFQVEDLELGNNGGQFYAGILGADGCMPAPVTRCDLSAGIVPDDATQTLTFHLASPDLDFLYALALDFAWPLRPDSVPANAYVTGPYPVTGPYQVASVTANAVRLVRNPRFRSWDPQIRPAGFADEVIWTVGIDAAQQVTMVETGKADYMAQQVPAAAFETLETQYTPQLHLAPQSTTSVFFNTQLPPFDNLAVRQAINFAVDRSAVSSLRGGAGVTSTTCQILPPNSPGYEPYCPYTADPAPSGAGPWKAPDLAAAQRLVAASGAADTPIIVGPFVPRLTPVARYMVELLRDIGFHDVSEEDATDGREVFKAAFVDHSVQLGAFEFIQDVPAADAFLGGFTCDEGDGLSNYCDPAFDDLVRQARDLQASDPSAAAPKWAEVERKVVDLALWCPLVNEGSDFVSARFGNYQFHLSYGVLLDQAWVK
jgi:YVTN family beta-propeller protein